MAQEKFQRKALHFQRDKCPPVGGLEAEKQKKGDRLRVGPGGEEWLGLTKWEREESRQIKQ